MPRSFAAITDSLGVRTQTTTLTFRWLCLRMSLPLRSAKSLLSILIGYGRTASVSPASPIPISNGTIAVPDIPGLGVEPDMDRIDQAHLLYRKLGKAARDDDASMQFPLPGWSFDPKRPCLVR